MVSRKNRDFNQQRLLSHWMPLPACPPPSGTASLCLGAGGWAWSRCPLVLCSCGGLRAPAILPHLPPAPASPPHFLSTQHPFSPSDSLILTRLVKRERPQPHTLTVIKGHVPVNSQYNPSRARKLSWLSDLEASPVWQSL